VVIITSSVLLGDWTSEELELLVSAVKGYGEGGINWEIVAKQVKTRDAKHCYKKWYIECSIVHVTIFSTGCTACAGKN